MHHGEFRDPDGAVSLAAAGFTVQHMWGGWNRDPIGHPDGEFLVVARA